MASHRVEGADPSAAADAAIAFVKAFDTWVRRASVIQAGESEPRLRLLYELHCNGPQKMSDLADVLGVTPRNITALVDGLEAESLVRRTPHPTDRRITLVESTEASSSKIAAQFNAFQGAVAALFDGLDPADRDTLVRVLESLDE